MSNHLDPLSNLLNLETIQEIDNLDLPTMQKHHLRILAHCLQILKIINVDNSLEYQNKNLLRDCLLYTSPSPRDREKSRMPSSA